MGAGAAGGHHLAARDQPRRRTARPLAQRDRTHGAVRRWRVARGGHDGAAPAAWRHGGHRGVPRLLRACARVRRHGAQARRRARARDRRHCARDAGRVLDADANGDPQGRCAGAPVDTKIRPRTERAGDAVHHRRGEPGQPPGQGRRAHRLGRVNGQVGRHDRRRTGGHRGKRLRLQRPARRGRAISQGAGPDHRGGPGQGAGQPQHLDPLGSDAVDWPGRWARSSAG